jgi:hypothetical protein
LVKQENWYSIIQYAPNSMRGEVLNVGLMLHAPEDGKLKFHLLESNNIKLKSLLCNDVLTETYKVQKDYINFLLDSLPADGTLFDSSKYTNLFLQDIDKKLPNGFRLSEPTFSKTANVEKLFQVLLENYIGKEFLSKFDEISQISTKAYVKDFFNQHKLIGTKIKSNVKFKPIRDIDNMQFLIDFVYKNGVINLLQSTPSNHERLNEWFTKLLTIIDATQTDTGFYVFYNENDVTNADKTLIEMLGYLKSKDSRVNNLEIHSQEFQDLSAKIATEGKSIEEFENEFAV